MNRTRKAPADLDQALETYVNNHDIAGGALLVRKNDKLVYEKKCGWADLEHRIPVEYDSIYRMMSLSKVSVAVAVMKLIEDGRVGLDDPLSKYIPAFANPRVVSDKRYEVKKDAPPTAFLLKLPLFRKDRVKTVAASRDVTIRDLLSHSSGIEMGVYGFLRMFKFPYTHTSLEATAAEYATYPLDFEPGTGTGYSGLASFDLLLRVCEIVSGMEAKAFMKTTVFDPLGMKDSAFVLTPEQEHRLVHVYKYEKGTLSDVTDTKEDMDSLLHRGPGYPSGSGGLYSTVTDYERLARMLCAEGAIDGMRYLKPETVRLMAAEGPAMHLEPEPGYVWGLGIKIRQNAEKGGFLATEGTYGWSGAFGTHLFVSPADHLDCVFVSNRSDAGGSGFYISRALEDLVFEVFAE